MLAAQGPLSGRRGERHAVGSELKSHGSESYGWEGTAKGCNHASSDLK